MKNQALKWIKENSMIVVLVLLFLLAPYAFRWVDPTSAVFEPGVLHKIVLACLAFSIYQLCTWSVVKTIWPDVAQYFKSGIFSGDFRVMPGNRKVVVALGVYFIILISFILLTCAFI